MIGREEPTDKELNEIEKALNKKVLFDEEFNDFQIMEEDFILDEDEDWYDDQFGEEW